MKIKLSSGIFLAITMVASAQTNSLTALLQQGLFEEQASRNLDAAIADYTTLAGQFDKDRQLAATAVFRLGECYRAQGRTNEAAAHYQRILKDFSDQPTLATLSRQNLVGMGAGKNETAAANVPAENPEAALLKKLEAMPREDLEKVLPTVLPDAALSDLLQKKNDYLTQRAMIVADYPTNNPRVTRVDNYLDELNRQLGGKISGMMAGLKLRAELPVAAPATAARNQQKELLAKQILLAEQDFTEKQKLVQLGQLSAAESRAAEREVLKLKQQLAALDSGRAELVDLSAPAKSEEDQEIERIEQLIKDSPDLINAAAGDGNPPMTQAAVKDQLKVATYLIEHGADVNGGGGSALISAASYGNRAMVELLLSRGANVNSKNSDRKTPLHLAAEKKFVAVVQVLLANKADVNDLDGNRFTPLVLAIQKGAVAVAATLLAQGADPNILCGLDRGFGNRTPTGTALHFAVTRGDEAIVALLLTNRADVTLRNQNGESALDRAASGNWPVIAGQLIAAGADVNAVGPDNQGGLTSLHRAAQVSREMVALLLEHGANPNITANANLKRTTPLMTAVAYNKPEIISLLLKHKANPDAEDSDADTALISAVQRKSTTALALLAGGANPNVSTRNGYPALVLALINNFADKELIAAFIEAKANVNAPDPEGKTLLHWAAEKNRMDLVELLVKAGADVNLRTKNGMTPLDFAKSSSLSLPPVPGQPTARQFSRPPNNSINSTTTNELSIVDLLRQHGALDALPDFTRIRITRQGQAQPLEVFAAGKILTNRFTLLETVMSFYNSSQIYGSWPASTVLPFPDFGRISIRRPSQKIGGKETEIKVSLLNRSNVVDCAQDVPVQFGDVIEIPESVHALNAPTPNPVQEMEDVYWRIRPRQILNATNARSFLAIQTMVESNTAKTEYWVCLQKSVQLVVAGETASFKVNSWKEGFLNQALEKTEARSALRSSSDLSRVKVTRKTGSSAKPEMFTVDVSDKAQTENNLWLQDGDVIEVPEK